MIIQTGMRTDIPAFYSKWFANRINEGKENIRKHNPKSPFLLGESLPEDVVHEAKQKSWIDRQISLFD